MGWLDLPRVPEPEVMDDSSEVEAYASATAQAHLDRIDDSFVEHALRLVRGQSSGRALDIGTGPGQIVLKLARGLPGWQLIGVDRSSNMIAEACANLEKMSGHEPQAGGGLERERGEAEKQGEGARTAEARLANRVTFFVADGNQLPFSDASFDLVMSNSVLHHLAKPERLLAEVARLARPGGGILLRDLRRPSRVMYPLHVRWHGRHYSGTMYRLYCASVRSAYTAQELEGLLRRWPILTANRDPVGPRVFLHGRTHLGIERAIR